MISIPDYRILMHLQEDVAASFHGVLGTAEFPTTLKDFITSSCAALPLPMSSAHQHLVQPAVN